MKQKWMHTVKETVALVVREIMFTIRALDS